MPAFENPTPASEEFKTVSDVARPFVSCRFAATSAPPGSIDAASTPAGRGIGVEMGEEWKRRAEWKEESSRGTVDDGDEWMTTEAGMPTGPFIRPDD
jgi:hypothetical protein